MKRLGLIMAIVATIAFAGPVSANHEMYKAQFDLPGIHGTVTVQLHSGHQTGDIFYNLDGLKDGNARIDVNAGPCWNNLGNIVLVWVNDRDFVGGRWHGTRILPEDSAYLFKDAMRDHGKVSVTIRNEGRAPECELFQQTHP